MSAAHADTFSIVIVCTGNICRSPIGEVLLRHHLDRTLGRDHPVTVTSAGTYAGHQGEPMQPHASSVLVERGADPSGFTATALRVAALEAADLVLTAEVEHRDTCARLHPPGAFRAFTLREFAGLVGLVVDSDPEVLTQPLTDRARALVQRADEHRRTAWPGGPAVRAEGIADPYLEPIEQFRRTADEIDAALAPLISALAYPAGPQKPAP